MPPKNSKYSVDIESVRRLWFHCQGLTNPRGRKLTRKAFVEHLERTGALQIDTSNVLERPHYLTLWSRFGAYDKALVDKWVYRDRVAFEYWGHVASIIPASRLPLSRRRMKRFSPKARWWVERMPSQASMRNVLRRLRVEGPLESVHFEKSPAIPGAEPAWKSKRALEVLWHRGKTAIGDRRHFRRVFDLAERVYPDGPTATLAEYEDGWLFAGLSGNGIAGEKHLDNYITAPRPLAPDRRRIIARNLKVSSVVEVEVDGLNGTLLALPEHMEKLSRLRRPRGTTLICPFDSFLWQRRRAEDLLGFQYRIEIYTPPAKRKFGYFAMPILHDGALVGRLDPKLHRDRKHLEIKSIFLESGFERNGEFEHGLAATLRDLAEFVRADKISLPGGWRKLL